MLVFDFDGTLAPLTLLPHFPRLSATTRRHLKTLAALGVSRGCPLVILSGRSVADLKKLMGSIPAHLIGNHGMEGFAPFRKNLGRSKTISQAWARIIERSWPQKISLWNSDIRLENKTYSLCFHYPDFVQKKRLTRDLIACASRLQPLPYLIPGPGLLNLIPPQAPTKADALRALKREGGAKQILYLGDDAFDEPIASVHVPGLIKVHVGVNTLNAPRWHKRMSMVDLRAQRQLFVGRQDQVDPFLEWLKQRI